MTWWCGVAASCTVLGMMVSDVRTRRIPDMLPCLFLLIAIVNSLWLGTWPGLWEAGIVFVAGFLLFCCHLMGGGDVKALAAGVLLVPGRLPDLLLVMSLTGGVMALCALLVGALRGRRPTDLPYGVAIGAGLLVCIWT